MRRSTIPTLGIRVMPDAYGACPRCGAHDSHADPALNFPNRSKVHDGTCWAWRCYNPKCTCGYYDPERNVVLETKPHEDDAEGLARQAARMAKVTAEVEEQLRGKTWVETSPGCWQAR